MRWLLLAILLPAIPATASPLVMACKVTASYPANDKVDFDQIVFDPEAKFIDLRAAATIGTSNPRHFRRGDNPDDRTTVYIDGLQSFLISYNGSSVFTVGLMGSPANIYVAGTESLTGVAGVVTTSWDCRK